MFVPLCCNLYRYVICQQRYKVFSVAAFYVFALLMVTLRIISNAFFSVSYDEANQSLLLANSTMITATFCRYSVCIIHCASQYEFVIRLKASILLAVSNKSATLITSLYKRKIRIMYASFCLVLLGAALLTTAVIIWEHRSPSDGDSPAALTFISVFLCIQDVIMVFAFMLLLKELNKYFKGGLASDRNRFFAVFGSILLSCLGETLYFLAESGTFFCESMKLQFADGLMTLVWDVPVILGVCYLHYVNFKMP